MSLTGHGQHGLARNAIDERNVLSSRYVHSPYQRDTHSHLVGTTFTHWIADHNVLWRTPLTEDAVKTSIQYYSLLHSAQQGYLGWAYLFVGCLAIAAAGGRMLKGLTMGEGGEVLFDGGSLGALTMTRDRETLTSRSVAGGYHSQSSYGRIP